MKDSIFYVVLTFRPRFAVVRTLLSGLESQNVIIVDNTPKEEKRDIARLESLHCVVIKTGKNLGYAGGMNKGIQFALSKGADWVVLCNDDLTISSKVIVNWNVKLKDSPPGLAGPFSGVLDPVRFTTMYPIDWTKVETRPRYLSGSFLAIHKDVFKKIGLFYEPYFIYYEDVEYCIRAGKVGFPLTQITLPSMRHNDGTTFGKGNFLHEYYMARNHLLFVQRNAPNRIKLREILRMPWTLITHYQDGNVGALTGVRDFAMKKFGEYKK